MEAEIREADARDYPRLLELYGQLHPRDDPAADAVLRTVFAEITAAPHLLLFVLEDEDGMVQATCYLNLIPNMTRGAASYGIIENVVTEETLRGRGLGQRIVKHALQVAWAEGCYKVMLQTGSQRESTHNFYLACGFRADDKFAFVARPDSMSRY